MQPTDQSLESAVVRNRQEAIVVSAEPHLSCAELAGGCGAAVCLRGTKPRSETSAVLLDEWLASRKLSKLGCPD